MPTSATERIVRGRDAVYQISEDGKLLRPGGEAELVSLKGNLLFKRYRRVRRSPSDCARLEDLAAIGGMVQEAYRLQHLDCGQGPRHALRAINWPIDVVPAEGGLSGVVIPRAADAFFRNPTRTRTLDGLYLLRTNPPALARRLGVLIRLCEVMAALRKLGAVYGDLSATNVLWALDPKPRVYLVDADGIELEGGAEAPARWTDWWKDPRLEAGLIQRHDRHSDDWALALAIWRVFTGRGEKQDQFHLDGGKEAKTRHVPESYLGVGSALRAIFRDPLATNRRLNGEEWAHLIAQDFLSADGRPLRARIAAAEQAHVVEYDQQNGSLKQRSRATRQAPPQPSPVPPRLPRPSKSSTSPTPRAKSRGAGRLAASAAVIAVLAVTGGIVAHLHGRAAPAKHETTRHFQATNGSFSADVPVRWTVTADDRRDEYGVHETDFTAPSGWVQIQVERTNAASVTYARWSRRSDWWSDSRTPISRRKGYVQLAFGRVDVRGRAYWQWRWRLPSTGSISDYFAVRCGRGVDITLNPRTDAQLPALINEAVPLLATLRSRC